MKQGQSELASSISQNKTVYFDNVLPIYEEREAENSVPLWKVMEELVLEKEKGLLKLKTVVDKFYDIKNYQQSVERAFAKGVKPPQMISEAERIQLRDLVQQIESRIIASQNRKSSVGSRILP